jgi:hypothetical protein
MTSGSPTGRDSSDPGAAPEFMAEPKTFVGYVATCVVIDDEFAELTRSRGCRGAPFRRRSETGSEPQCTGRTCLGALAVDGLAEPTPAMRKATSECPGC